MISDICELTDRCIELAPDDSELHKRLVAFRHTELWLVLPEDLDRKERQLAAIVNESVPIMPHPQWMHDLRKAWQDYFESSRS